MNKIRTLAGLTATIVLAAGSLAAAPPAQAAPVKMAASVAATIERLAPEVETPAHGRTNRTATTANPQSDMRQGIPVSFDGEPARPSTRILLPSNFGGAKGETLGGSSVYLADDHADGAVSVTASSDGFTRVILYIEKRASIHKASFGLQDHTAHLRPDGGAIFIAPDGAFVPVEAPWAKDAAGNSVPTHYRAVGDRLEQVVTPSASTQYPIVADPTWKWMSGGFGMHLNRQETNAVQDYGAAGSMCALLAKAAPAGSVICGIVAGYIVTQANVAIRQRKCLFIVAVPTPGVTFPVTGP